MDDAEIHRQIDALWKKVDDIVNIKLEAAKDKGNFEGKMSALDQKFYEKITDIQRQIDGIVWKVTLILGGIGIAVKFLANKAFLGKLLP